MRILLLTGLSLSCGVILSSIAQAALILDGFGNAVGVTHVEINGILYDVTFNVGSYNDAFGSGIDPSPLPTFGNGDSAASLAALEGIRFQLNQGNVPLVADGLSGLTADSVVVPYDHTATRFYSNWSGQTPPLPWGSTGLLAHTRIAKSALGRTYAFARFEEKTTVPEPPSFVLSGLSFVAVAAMIRRRRIRSHTNGIATCVTDYEKFCEKLNIRRCFETTKRANPTNEEVDD